MGWVFHWYEAKKNSKWPTKKIQNGRLKKTSFSSSANSQYFFMKFLWIGPWVSRIDWCEGHWFGSTYMVVRLSDISSKTDKKCVFCVFRLFVGQPHDHISWDISMPFASINSTYPRTNPWNFCKKILRIGGAGRWHFFGLAILNLGKASFQLICTGLYNILDWRNHSNQFFAYGLPIETA